MKITIGTKFAVLSICLIMITAAGTSWFILSGEIDTLYNEVYLRGSSFGRLLAENSEYALYSRDVRSLDRLVDSIHADEHIGYIFVFDANGRLIRSRSKVSGIESPPAPRSHSFAEGTDDIFIGELSEHVGGEKFLDIVAIVKGRSFMKSGGTAEDDGPVTLGYIQLGYSLEHLDEHIRRLIDATAWITILLVLIGSAITLLFTRRITRPVRRLAGAAREITNDRLDQDIMVTASDEVGDLADAFRHMIDHLRSYRIKVKEHAAALAQSNKELKNEIDERKALEDELVQHIDMIKGTLESVTHPFYMVDAKTYKVLMANSTACPGGVHEGLKCYDVMGRLSGPCDSLGFPCTLTEIRKTGRPVIIEQRHGRGSDGEKHFEFCGYPIFDSHGNVERIIEYVIDVTDRKKQEEEFMNVRNLEALGRLSAGIAHEINNPLTSASMSLQMMKKEVTDSTILRRVKSVERNVDKAAAIAKEVLQFSRLQKTEFVSLDVRDVLKSSLILLRHRLGGITVNERYRLVPRIRADYIKLEQVFVNLLMNAADSMGREGRIDINIMSETGAVVVQIADNGAGITVQNLPKVFDPFFTTKTVGKGTGLGLSICYGIINDHGGSISIESSEGRGTTVTVRLPVIESGDDKVKKE